MKKVSSEVKFILTHNDASIVLEKPKSDIKTLQNKPTPCAYTFFYTAHPAKTVVQKHSVNQI